ncbi:serine protein kinase RIO [Desertihabitans aurantiacus]|uniref:serine protein kinase RIO n=1 Tax=Desertihabitans aurantiacus TaxID=2282477 RepID=UPI0018E51803|nr:RIO1 family regulatory kinase/ATPase [Desertihabitans aurantiacus]
MVTADAAVDTELGVLKSGKEAVCHLLRRAVPGDPDRDSLLVAKRYLDADRRDFQRSTVYTEGRRTRNSRDARALARRSSHGRAVAAGQWAQAEWDTLVRLWQAGVGVPYPVQVDGTEILMEYIAVDGEAAPRLADCRGTSEELRSWYDQVVDAMERMASLGLAHGDLSPFNLLLAGSRVVVIDLPQVVDVTVNPNGMELLHRDCRNVGDWFGRRGLDVDAEELFGRLVAALW